MHVKNAISGNSLLVSIAFTMLEVIQQHMNTFCTNSSTNIVQWGNWLQAHKQIL